jgi:Na+/melibiose symporter-like transporter
VTVAAERTRRPRRQRSVTESLLSVALVLEAVLMFFVAITANGLKALPTAVALGGGAAAIVLLLAATALLRWPVGVWVGWVLQAALLLTGLVLPVMWGVGALFVAIWIYCFVTARRLERRAVPTTPTTDPDQGEP